MSLRIRSEYFDIETVYVSNHGLTNLWSLNFNIVSAEELMGFSDLKVTCLFGRSKTILYDEITLSLVCKYKEVGLRLPWQLLCASWFHQLTWWSGN